MFNSRGNNAYRAEQIGKQLAQSFDIIGLNEVFQDTYREALLAEIKKVWGENYHVVAGPAPTDPKRYNGGLAIVSRYPFLETNSVIYDHISMPKDFGFGADGFASKGVLHARVCRDTAHPTGNTVDVFVSHLEARSREMREEQYKEIGAFIGKTNDPSLPVLILGDFNTRGNPEYQSDQSSPYHRLLAQLNLGRPGAPVIDLWPAMEKGLGGTNEQESSETGGRIDYIFLSNPKGNPKAIIPLSVKVNPYPDETVKFLSDHSAVEAELRWPTAR
jgi:endonuclease/exonuclease/phosphatase family metal-dependent hydrolase